MKPPRYLPAFAVFGAWRTSGKHRIVRRNGRGRTAAECRCACGTVRLVLVANLLTGRTRGCGCGARDEGAQP